MRKRHALTQAEAAQVAGVSLRTWSRGEAGHCATIPRPSTVGGVARAMDVPSPIIAPGWALWGRALDDYRRKCEEWARQTFPPSRPR